MLKHTILALALLAACGFADAARAEPSDADIDAKERERAKRIDICKTTMCRPEGRANFTKTDGTRFTVDFPAPLPYVQNGTISIMAAETLYVEVAVSGNRLVDLTAVPEIRNADTTLTLNFKKMAESWLLTISNPLPHTVKYHAQMMLPEGDELYHTSSCPIRPGLTNHELWPHAIFQLILFDFRTIDDDGDEAGLCIY